MSQRQGRWAPHPKHPLQKDHSPTAPIKPPSAQRAFGNCCVSLPSSPPHPQKTSAPPVPSEPSIRTTRAGHLPSQAASHPSPERLGFSHAFTAAQPAGNNNVSLPRHLGHGAHALTVASSRRTRSECPLPTTTPTSLPDPFTHLQPTAAAGMSRGGQQERR